MPKVKLTVTESRCRCGYVKKGQDFIVEDLCPPLCHGHLVPGEPV